jgi:hypothetical protein
MWALLGKGTGWLMSDFNLVHSDDNARIFFNNHIVGYENQSCSMCGRECVVAIRTVEGKIKKAIYKWLRGEPTGIFVCGICLHTEAEQKDYEDFLKGKPYWLNPIDPECFMNGQTGE